jgi:hypothetical protein
MVTAANQRPYRFITDFLLYRVLRFALKDSAPRNRFQRFSEKGKTDLLKWGTRGAIQGTYRAAASLASVVSYKENRTQRKRLVCPVQAGNLTDCATFPEEMEA